MYIYMGVISAQIVFKAVRLNEMWHRQRRDKTAES